MRLIAFHKLCLVLCLIFAHLIATVPPFFQCIGDENVGHPVPVSYWSEESNNFPSQLTQQKVPASFTLIRSLLKAGSGPVFSRVTRY